MAVRISLPDDHGSFFVDDLTLDEAVVVEQETGESWLHLNPVRSASQARSIMVRFLCRTMSEDKARVVVGGMTVGDFSKAVAVVKDDRPDEFNQGMPVTDPKEGGDEPGMT